MKIIFSFLCFTLFSICQYGYAQSNNYKVIYEGLISTDDLLKEFDSIKVVGDNAEEGKIPISKVPVMNISIMKLLVLANKERVVVHRMGQSNVRDADAGKGPDSSIFENEEWYNYSDGIKSLKSASFTGNIVKLSEVKTINGYDCIKYLWQVPEQKRTTELWVAKALPFTISPFTVRIPVEGAILESRQLGSNFIFKLVEIIKE